MSKLFTGFLLVLGLQGAAQDFQGRIYNAYLRGRMDLWEDVMEQMERKAAVGEDLSLLYELTEAQYGYIGYCISMKKKKEAGRLLDAAEAQAQRLLDEGVEIARVYSLIGAFYGYRVSLQPIRAPHFGRKSEEANNQALKHGPREPQAWLEKGNIAFYKPAMFGGSKEEAVPYYEKAVRLFEESPGRTNQNWIYLNCLAGLGLAYEETDQPEKAGKVYEKLLGMEPDFEWVRDELYPQYLKKQSRN